MFFFLEYTHQTHAEMDIQQGGMPEAPEPGILYLVPGKQRVVSLEVAGGGKLVLLGDPIPGEWENPSAPFAFDTERLYEKIRGHYVWFLMRGEVVWCGCSLGGIYPVYYRTEGQRTLLCSSAAYLAQRTAAGRRNKRNLLERLLFNYPFFDSTWWEGIRLLDAHGLLRLNAGSAKTEPGFDISRHFGSPGEGKLDELTQLFREEVERFFPDAPFGISLTGGFDGRTLVAAARQSGRSFLTYSFGRPGTDDIAVPEAQARKLGIPYLPIRLDEAYVAQESFASGMAFLQQTGYNGNLGRPHYQYAARLLSEKVDYILTGNFGSELFRALHQPGVMMTSHLIDFFGAADESWKDRLAQAVDQLDPVFFKEEKDGLIADLEQYREARKDWDANARFYYFVYNELFRKYFGPELVMQSHYLNNRTPFLSLPFIQALNQTRWSGLHARLFEQAKYRRMKGQLFYAAFIRQADPELYRMRTGKGYAPADVLEPWRLPLLAAQVILQKKFKKEEADSNSVDAFFQRFREQIREEWVAESLPFQTPLRDLEETIKWYSIATGWKAADTWTPQTIPQHDHFL